MDNVKRAIKKILITAGPTREMLDPVRFLSNLSTGIMGYTLAEVARRKGYRVTLISGPTALRPPSGVTFIPVVSAKDLQKVCRREFPKSDALIMSAAVCDFTATAPHRQKIARTRIRQLHLKQTPDVLAGLARGKGRRLAIGFCLETENWLANARKKIVRKHLDGIVANYYTQRHVPFGNRRINAALVARDGKGIHLKGQNKRQIAVRILKWAEEMSAVKIYSG